MSADRDPLRYAFIAELTSICTAQGITSGSDWMVKDTLNSLEDPDVAHPYIDLDFPGGSESQLTIGSPGSNLWRETGQVTIGIHVPLGNVAQQKASELKARILRNQFRGRRFTMDDGSRILIEEVSPMGSGQDAAGLWVETIALSYRVHNTG